MECDQTNQVKEAHSNYKLQIKSKYEKDFNNNNLTQKLNCNSDVHNFKIEKLMDGRRLRRSLCDPRTNQ